MSYTSDEVLAALALAVDLLGLALPVWNNTTVTVTILSYKAESSVICHEIRATLFLMQTLSYRRVEVVGQQCRHILHVVLFKVHSTM